MTVRRSPKDRRTRTELSIEDWFAAWSDINVDRLLAFYTQDCVYFDPSTKSDLHGHVELKAHFANQFRRWPEQEWREVRSWLHPNGLTLEWEATISSPRTGRDVTFRGLDLLEIEGGKIAVQRVYFDPTLWRALI